MMMIVIIIIIMIHISMPPYGRNSDAVQCLSDTSVDDVIPAFAVFCALAACYSLHR